MTASRWLVLALPVLALGVFFWMFDWPSLRVASGTVTGPNGRTTAISLPYSDRSDVPGLRETYRLTLRSTSSGDGLLQIVPDDCVRAMVINGQPFPLTDVAADRLCDFRRGFVVDVGPQLTRGDNALELVVENVSGPHGISVSSIRRGARNVLVTTVLLPLLLVGACFAAARAWRLPRLETVLVAVALAAAGWLRYRFVFDWQRPEDFIFSDMGGYVNHGREIAQGAFDISQTFQPMGYPLMLAASLRLCGDFTLADLVQVLLGWATVALVWRATARWLGERPAIFALALASLHVPFLSLAGFFLPETTFTFELALLYYLLVLWPFPWKAWQALLLGVLFMSGQWLKGNNTFFGPLLVLWMVVWALARKKDERRESLRRLLRPFVGFCAGAALVLGIHGATTHALYHRTMLSAGTGALNLVEGKCPAKKNFDTQGIGWQSPLFAQLQENTEKHWDHPFSDQGYFWRAGIDCIRNDPRVLLTSLRYVYYLFFDNQLWPPNTTQWNELVRTSGMLYSMLLFPLIAYGFVVAVRKPKERGGLVALMAISIVVCSWALKSEMRYRVPFDVVFLPMAVLGAMRLLPRLTSDEPEKRA